MRILVNGQSCTVPDGYSLKALLTERHLDAQEVVIEHNKNIIPQDRLAEVRLAEGDQLELLSFVGGG